MATELRRRGVSVWEVAGMLGHKTAGYRTTEIYAKYDPDYLGQAVKAIDAYFIELQNQASLPLIVKKDNLRAGSVRAIRFENPQVIDLMVGAVGFEPTTPTMSP